MNWQETLKYISEMEKGRRILVDSGVMLPTKDTYSGKIYPAERFRELDYSDLRNSSDIMRITFSFLCEQNVFTSTEVYEETRIFADMISNKLRTLNQRFKSSKTYHRNYNQSEDELSKEALEEFSCRLSHLSRKLGKRIAVENNGPQYELLFREAVGKSERMKLKRKSRPREEFSSSPCPHADEDLVVSGYILALGGIETTILSNDSDVPRIVSELVPVVRRLEGRDSIAPLRVLSFYEFNPEYQFDGSRVEWLERRVLA